MKEPEKEAADLFDEYYSIDRFSTTEAIQCALIDVGNTIKALEAVKDKWSEGKLWIVENEILRQYEILKELNKIQ